MSTIRANEVPLQVSQARKTSSPSTSSPKRLSPQEHRQCFNSYHATVGRILTCTVPAEKERLIKEFDLDKAISDVESSLGVSVRNNKLEISSAPSLIRGKELNGNHSRKWSLILNGSLLLTTLYKSRANRTNQAIDQYKAEFFEKFQDAMKWIKGTYPATEVRDIKQRLLSFSHQQGIGREGLEREINSGRNLLALSIWVAKEYVAKTHPMPDFFPEISPAAEAAKPIQPSVSETVHRAKQGLLFE